MQLGRRVIPTIPVHLWADADGIPSFVPLSAEMATQARALEAALAGAGVRAMPKEVVTQRSKKLRAMKLEDQKFQSRQQYGAPPMSPGIWRMVKNEVAVVRGDVEPGFLKLTAVYALELYVMLRSFIGGWDPGRHLISTRLFKNGTEYKRAAALAGAPNAETYYSPISSEIVMWFSQYGSDELFLRSFAHEFTHAYVDRIFRKTGPVWLMEGIAEWFSNVEWRGDILVPGQMHRYSLQLLSMAPIPLSIKTLTTIPREEIYGYRFQQYYAQAWSLVDYLMTQLPYRTVEGILNGDLFDFVAHEEAWKSHVEMMLSAAGYSV